MLYFILVLYVDLIENISVLMNFEGKYICSTVYGYIRMKSYLHGSPNVSLALSNDVVIGKENFNKIRYKNN